MALLKSYYKIYRAFQDPDYLYIQNEYAGNNTFTLTKTGTPNSTDLSYSKDKSTWTAFDLTQSTNTVSLAQGEKLYLRSSTGFSKDSNNYFKLGCNHNFSVGGKVATLFDYQNLSTFTAIPDYGCFYLLADTNVYDVYLDLSGITQVGASAFYRALKGNLYSSTKTLRNLTVYAPDVISNGNGSFEYLMEDKSASGSITLNFDSLQILAGFTNCFSTSSDTTTITALFPSATRGGLQSTFHNCTNLTNLILDISSLTDASGWSSFTGCFYGCRSLITAPDLSNITSVHQDYSESNASFGRCFQNCTSLNYVKTPNISTWGTYPGAFTNWLDNVSATGVVSKPAALSIPTDSNSGVPTGWTTTNY